MQTNPPLGGKCWADRGALLSPGPPIKARTPKTGGDCGISILWQQQDWLISNMGKIGAVVGVQAEVVLDLVTHDMITRGLTPLPPPY